MAFYVFDLDGTLADNTHRQHLVPRKDTNDTWDAFTDACVDDKPIWHTIDLLRDLAGRNRIEIWTGRSDRARGITRLWLLRHHIGMAHYSALVMRPHTDHRPDYVLKKEFLTQRGRPTIIFDDRNSVVEMWRREGIPCFHVKNGDF